MIIINNSTLKKYNNHSSKFKSNPLKNELIKILNQYYVLESEHGITYRTEKLKYPIAIKYTYENYGISKDTVILYEYFFKTYYSENKRKIKSYGLEFIKYLPNDIQKIQSEIIKFNLNNSFLNNFPNSIFKIKEELIKRDSVLSPILDLVNLNLKFTEHSIMVEDTLNRGIYYIAHTHRLTQDNSEEKKEAVSKIKNILRFTDKDLKEAIQHVYEKELLYINLKISIPVDSLPQNTKIQVFKDEYKSWYDANTHLKNMLFRRVKI